MIISHNIKNINLKRLKWFELANFFIFDPSDVLVCMIKKLPQCDFFQLILNLSRCEEKTIPHEPDTMNLLKCLKLLLSLKLSIIFLTKLCAQVPYLSLDLFTLRDQQNE